MSKEIYEQQAEVIEAIQKVVKPNLPIPVAIEEAEELYLWVQNDRAALERVGLSWQLVDDLPLRAAACRYIEGEWQNHLSTTSDAEKEWMQKREEAKVLSVDLTRALRFALRRKLNVLGAKKPTSCYMSQTAFIEYCYNIAFLAADYTEQLQAVGFDLSRLDGACDAAEHLSVLLARVHTERGEQYIIRNQRNRAYTHLKEAVDQIRRCGKFAFASQPERLKGYASAYGRKSRK
jgi:hypothetical protein